MRQVNHDMPPFEALEITDEKFKEFADATLKVIEENDLGKGGMNPVLFIHARPWQERQLGDIEGMVVVIDQEFNNQEIKTKVLKQIGAQVAQMKLIPVAVFMASEAWMSMGTKEQPLDMNLMPSQDPNRKECIIVAGKTIMRDCQIGMMIPIKRDKDGNMIRDGETTITHEIGTFILNQFFIGYFEQATGQKVGEQNRP